MFKNLYDQFKHYFSLGGTVYFYSDPHFSDIESYKIRFPEEFNFEGCDVRPSDEWIVEELDKKQIKNINSKVSKYDTLIILGDVGNIECVKKLKAGYKVLILGNHDKGASNYLSKNTVRNHFTDAFEYETIDNGKWYIKTLDEVKLKFLRENPGYNITEIKKHEPYGMGITEYYITGKENLFDEVYEGKLQISPKIVLTHIPLYDKYSLNIHGHDHNLTDFKQYVLGTFDSDMDQKEILKNYLQAIYKNNLHNLNVIAEILCYQPINLNDIVKSGILKNIPDQVEEYLDNIRKEN